MSRKRRKQQSEVRKKAGESEGGAAEIRSIRKGEGTSSRVFILSVSIIVVAVVALTAHWSVLSAGALSFDDHQYLTQNQLVQNPGWGSVRRFLCEVLEPSTVRGYYQPLTMISLMFDYALGGRGDNLRPFHMTSLCLHIFNTALVVVLLYQLFGRLWVAAVVGLLFGLHPMTVETIAWVGERKTVLATFFSLWSLNFYVSYVRRGGWKLYGGAVLMYVLALMSKPTSAPLPVLMLVLDYWPLRRFGKRTVVEKVPMFVIGVLSAVITVVSQTRTANVAMPGEYPVTALPLVVCHNIVFYLYKIVWPVNLSCHYPFPHPFGLSQPMVLTGVVGTFVLVVLLVVSLRWTRALAAGWLFFFIAISPTMQVIGFSNTIAADKFAYLPAVGLLVAGAYLLICVWSSISSGERAWLCRAVVVTTLAVVAAAEAFGTRRYLVHWRDTESLYLHIIDVSPDAAIPHNNLGAVYYERGRVEEAIKYWAKALVINPDCVDALNNLAWVLATSRDPEIRDGSKAVWLSERACKLSGYKQASKLDTLAAAYAEAGRFDKAVETAQKALELSFRSKREALADEIGDRLRLYKNRQAYREL